MNMTKIQIINDDENLANKDADGWEYKSELSF